MITATRIGVRANRVRVEGDPGQSVASLCFDNGLERFQLTVDAPGESLVEAYLADPTPVVYADRNRVSVEYPLGTRLLRRADQSSVRLSPSVPWDLDVHSGAAHSTIDLSGGQVSGISFHGGLAHTTLVLPRPTGECLMRLRSAQAVTIICPDDVPVRLELAKGVAGLQFDHHRHDAASAYFAAESDGYSRSVGRYLITAGSGVSDLRVGRAPGR